MQAADREVARQTACAMSPERWAARAEVLRPVSEWAARELVVALSITAEAVEGLLERSLTLVHRLLGDTTRWWAELEQWLLADDVGPPDLPDRFSGTASAPADACRADAVDEAARRNGPAGQVDAADDALAALEAAADEQRAVLADLLTRNGGGGLADRPRLVLADALTGSFLALTGLPELRRATACGARRCRQRPGECTHDRTGRPRIGPPGPTDGYRPGAELDRFVRARDRRCRFPGCRRRVPCGGELDHAVAYRDGPTSAANLTGYCTTDHRGKHQAPGWRHELAADGALTVTIPTGLTAVTTPPPY
ncbi:HNH endonuclease signature motif containing protein [Modestobacter sp. SYSU DS0875]